MEQQNQNNESFEQAVDKVYSGQTPPPPSTGVQPDFKSNPYQVQERVTGKTPGPLPTQTPPSTPKVFDAKANAAAVRDYMSGNTIAHEDKNDWGKAYNYNSGPNGFFYDRYSKIEQPGVLEFSPQFSDNESYYNANTSWAGDMYRSMRYSMAPLFWEGVKSSYASTAKILQGDFFGEDKQAARNYAYYTGLTYSTKDNLGSFVNNLFNNFSYTMGIMATAMGENFVGAAFGATKALTNSASKLAFRNYKAGKAFDGMKTYTQMLEELKDINKVREHFNAAKGASRFQKALQSPVGRTLNPLSNLTDNAFDILNQTDDIAGYFGSMKNFTSTAGAAYRDFRNINLAISEARLEAGMVYNNVFDELYNDYYTATGKNPDDEKLEQMISAAKQAAAETSYMNTGLIYFSNKIAFDNILNPRIGTRGFLAQRVTDWKKVGGGKFGDLGSIALDAKDATWKFYDKGFKTWYSKWKTDPFSKSALNTIGYFKRNLSEGIQETLQETIAHATENYYKDAYYSGAVRKNFISKAAFGDDKSHLDYYQEGLQKQFSKEGLSVFLSGFAMGTLAGGLNKTMTTLYEKSHQIFDPKGYETYKQEKTKITEELLTKLNAMTIKEWSDNRLFNGGTQEILASVQNDGTKKEVMDAESEAMVNHILTLHDYGVLDMQIEAFQSMQQMTEAEWKEAFPKLANEDIQKYKSRINDVVAKAGKIKDRLDTYVKAYPNPIDLNRYSKDDDFYEDAYIMHHMWNFGLKSAVFYNETFDNVRDRMVGIMNKFYSERPLQSMTKRQSDILLRPEELKNEIGLLGNEINGLLSVGDPESKELARKKKQEQKAYQDYYDAYTAFSLYYNRDKYYNKAKLILQQDKAEGEEVTEEEIQAFLDSEIGPKSKEAEEDLMNNLEKEYNKLLKSMSGKPDDYLFTKNVDESFEMILDFYKLNDESREMVDYINLMNDPQGFMDVFERNVKWMTDLWLKRGDYYNDIVSKELSSIEDNGLLNQLAQQGIFIDLNDYIQWRDEGIPPREFFDQKKQLVIPEGSLAYDRYYGLLQQRQALMELGKMAKKEAAKASIDVRIAQLLERKAAQLAKAEALFEENLQETTGESREEWEKKEPATEGRTQEEIDDEIKSLQDVSTTIENSDNVEEILAQYAALEEQGLLPENFAEIVDEEAKKNEAELKAFFKSTKESGFDQQTRIQAANMKFALPRVLADRINQVSEEQAVEEIDRVAPIQTTKAWQDYQTNVEKINTRYDALVKRLESEREQVEEPEEDTEQTKEPQTRKPSDVKVTTETPFEELPEDFKKELETKFDEIVSKPTSEAGLGQTSDLKKVNLDKYELLRNNWFEQQQELVDEYNSRKITVKVPELKYDIIKNAKPINEYGITTLVSLRKKLTNILDANYNEGKKLTAKDRENIKEDIKNLTDYINFRRQSYVPKNDKARVWMLFEQMVLNKQNEARRILDENGQTIGYELEGVPGQPIRVTKLSEKIEIDMTPGKTPFAYSPIEEPGVDPKTGKPKGQLINLFREINTDTDIKPEEKVNMFMSSLETQVKEGLLAQLKSARKLKAIREALEENFNEATLKSIVQKVAYDESTTAGNELDGLIREAFTIDNDGQFIIPAKPKKMSQEAYDNLFGEKGVITELQDRVRDGRYTIFSSDAMVFDATLSPYDESGIIGAMDLIVFDNVTDKVKIIDIKTGKLANWTEFNNPKSYKSKKLNYRLQQSIYRTLLYNMTGELAEISLLPVAIEVDMDGNIKSAEPVASTVNQDLIRDIKAQISTLEKASKPDQEKINKLKDYVKAVENSSIIVLEPVDNLSEYGVVMKKPEVPDNLKPESIGKQSVEDQLTPEEAKKQLTSLKGQLTRTKNKLEKLNPAIPVGDKVMQSPEVTKLLERKENLEKEIARLQEILDKASEKETDEDIDNEIEISRKGVSGIIPKTPQVENKEFNDILEKMRNTKDINELNDLYNDALVLMLQDPIEASLAQEMENIKKTKTEELNTDVSPQNLQVKEYLISKNPIFGTEENEIVVIKEIKDNGKVTVKQIGVKKPRQKTFTADQIKKDFIKTTEEALNKQDMTEPVTEDQKTKATISKSSIKDLATDPELLDKAKKDAAEKDSASRLGALKDAAKKNNISNCE